MVDKAKPKEEKPPVETREDQSVHPMSRLLNRLRESRKP